jgi:hypothetical protein
MSASAAINPFSHLVHMHPRSAQPDNRISIVLSNTSVGFRDVKIGGQVYTVQAHRTMDVKAPAGTVIYAVSPELSYRRGDAIVELTPQLDHKTVTLN